MSSQDCNARAYRCPRSVRLPGNEAGPHESHNLGPFVAHIAPLRIAASGRMSEGGRRAGSRDVRNINYQCGLREERPWGPRFALSGGHDNEDGRDCSDRVVTSHNDFASSGKDLIMRKTLAFAAVASLSAFAFM